MEEPTVLDYVKSKIFFWQGNKVEVPPLDAPDMVLTDDSPHEEYTQPATQVEPAPQEEIVPAEPFDIWPLLHLIVPLALALLAQRFLEPPERSIASGVILYSIAAAWVIWAIMACGKTGESSISARRRLQKVRPASPVRSGIFAALG